MSINSSLEERCYRILEEKGGQVADEARTILLKEESLKALQHPLQHISKNWRDPFTPSMVTLSCEAVGGKTGDATHQAALAMALMNLSFCLWDDIVDKTLCKGFVPTVLGKFGEGVTLMIGGLASAKAFSILGEMKVNETKRRTITGLVWGYWSKLAKAEATNLELRVRSDVKPEEKLNVIEMQAVSLEISLKIGAVLGNSSEDEMERLGNYGRYLGIILDLGKDFKSSVNLTLELAEKIRRGAFPYTLLWARNHSEKIRQCLPLLTNAINPIDIRKIVEAVLETKALENTVKLLNTLTQKGEAELLDLKNKEHASTLKFLLQAQTEIFRESLSAFEF